MPGTPTTSNRLGLDYRAQGARLGGPVVPIVDIHTHINGPASARIYDDARRLFGVHRTYSMTQIRMVPAVRDVLGDSIRFIAFPSFFEADRARSHREGYVEVIDRFAREHGARMLKLWGSPRLRDIVSETAPYGASDLCEIDAPWRRKACEAGERWGMMYMIHVADPDTWFQAKYSDATRYGTKRQQYEGLERMLDRFTAPWIAAHMGGWPEDLVFLDGLLSRHPNLHLDTSATKWVVRELGRHPVEETRAFFIKWKGRLLFGSDLVVTDDQLSPQKSTPSPMSDLADSPESAFELYASRYWALRTMFETDYSGESPIADPDLAMVDPAHHTPMSAPILKGLSLDRDLLATLYAGAAASVVERWERENPL